MKAVFIDTDVSGTSSISHLIESGHVESFSCGNLKAAEGVIQSIRRGQIHADIVFLDTITGVTARTRQMILYDFTSGASVWDKRKQLRADWDTYRDTSDLTNYLATMLMMLWDERKIPHVIVAHEKHTSKMASRVDPISGGDRYVPNLQDGINQHLYAFTDAIVRLTYAPLPFIVDGQSYPQNTRILIMSPLGDPTGNSSAGVRVTPGVSCPSFLVVPENDPYAYRRFVQAMGRVPASMLLYGPQKIGKTTFLSGAAYL